MTRCAVKQQSWAPAVSMSSRVPFAVCIVLCAVDSAVDLGFCLCSPSPSIVFFFPLSRNSFVFAAVFLA